jgi:hypothetical protein
MSSDVDDSTNNIAINSLLKLNNDTSTSTLNLFAMQTVGNSGNTIPNDNHNNLDTLMSFYSKDYLIRTMNDNNAQNNQHTTKNIEFLNLVSAMDDSSDAISFTDSQDDSDDVLEMILLNTESNRLLKSIFIAEII